MTPAPGEIWLADRGDEVRRQVFVISDERFQRLAERVVVAPLLAVDPPVLHPWHVRCDFGCIATNQLATVPSDRLLERTGMADLGALRRVRYVVREIVG